MENSNIDKKPKLSLICTLYSICVLLFIFVGFRVQHKDFYIGAMITEILLIFLPPIIFLYIYKFDIKSTLRLNSIKVEHFFITIGIMLFALPVVSIINLANILLVKYVFGRFEVSKIPEVNSFKMLLLNIFVVAVLAGICEEVLFRGVIQRGFERLGTKASIVLTSILFALIHLDFQKILGIFVLGVLIGYIVYKTNSLFTGMLAHFTNNFIGVMLSFFAQFSARKTNDIDFSIPTTLNKETLIALIIIAIFFIFSAGCLALLLYALNKTTTGSNNFVIFEKQEVNYKHFSYIIPSFIAIVFIYYAQGLKLLNMHNDLIDNILKLLAGVTS